MAVNPNDLLRSYPAASSSKQLMNAAALDIAFDVFLAGMRGRGLFEACDIVFKGGTALRKFRLGHKSRFSFDLDFAIADGGEDMLVEEMTGYDHEGFKFDFIERRGHHLLFVESPLFTDAAVSTKVDFSNRPCWLPPEELPPIPSPALPSGIWGSTTTVPNMRLEENVAEKLARWQSRRLVRDLYDLAAVSNRIEDMSLVARLYVLKSHRNWSSALPSRRPPQAASLLSSLTSDALISGFELDDLVLAATVSDSDKRTQLRNDLALVSYMAESVDQHILGTDLEDIAADTGKLGWRVEQEIGLLKAEHDVAWTAGEPYEKDMHEAAARAAVRSHKKSGGASAHRVCDKRMPVAQANCVLPAGHAPPCRSRR